MTCPSARTSAGRTFSGWRVFRRRLEDAGGRDERFHNQGCGWPYQRRGRGKRGFEPDRARPTPLTLIMHDFREVARGGVRDSCREQLREAAFNFVHGWRITVAKTEKLSVTVADDGQRFLLLSAVRGTLRQARDGSPSPMLVEASSDRNRSVKHRLVSQSELPPGNTGWQDRSLLVHNQPRLYQTETFPCGATTNSRSVDEDTFVGAEITQFVRLDHARSASDTSQRKLCVVQVVRSSGAPKLKSTRPPGGRPEHASLRTTDAIRQEGPSCYTSMAGTVAVLCCGSCSNDSPSLSMKTWHDAENRAPDLPLDASRGWELVRWSASSSGEAIS